MSKAGFLSKKEIEQLLEGQENKLNKLLADFQLHKGSAEWINEQALKTKGTIKFLRTLLSSHQLLEKTKK